MYICDQCIDWDGVISNRKSPFIRVFVFSTVFFLRYGNSKCGLYFLFQCSFPFFHFIPSQFFGLKTVRSIGFDWLLRQVNCYSFVVASISLKTHSRIFYLEYSFFFLSIQLITIRLPFHTQTTFNRHYIIMLAEI